MGERILQIPTKRFIADYIRHCIATGEMSVINNIIELALLNKNKELFRQKKEMNYECKVAIQFTKRARLSHQDTQLCAAKVNYFNNTMASHIRSLLFQNIKVYMYFDKNITRAISHSLQQLNIDEEHYSYDTIAKYYQRHRRQLGLPSVYKKSKLPLCS